MVFYQVVGVKGFEPLSREAADFKSAVYAVPPHPHVSNKIIINEKGRCRAHLIN